MPHFNLAHRTLRGASTPRDLLSLQPHAIAFGYGTDEAAFVERHRNAPPGTLFAEATLSIALNPQDFSLRVSGLPETIHYHRYADATLTPLPPTPPPFTLERGDCYLALSAGLLSITDAATIARFVHLRDYFNAEKLVQAIVREIEDMGEVTHDVTILVIERR